MMEDTKGLTPTHQRIYDILRDCQPHPLDELRACFDDDLSTPDNIYTHLSQMRTTLRPRGIDIVVRKGKAELVRIVASANDGRR